jgi:hypothetical protein
VRELAQTNPDIVIEEVRGAGKQKEVTADDTQTPDKDSFQAFATDEVSPKQKRAALARHCKKAMSNRTFRQFRRLSHASLTCS